MRPTPLPAFSDNYIWLLPCGDGLALVVDPGLAEPVNVALAASGLRLAGILLTHHHDDHVGGVADLLRQWPNATVVAPDDERIADATQRVGEGDTVTLGSLGFETLAVPGHTVSHVAFHGHGLLFCGDTLFSLGCGRLFEGSAEQMLGSLDRMAALPGDTLVCCGHEYTQSNAAFARAVDPDNAALARRSEEVATMRTAGQPTVPVPLADERATNPFLRIDSHAIRQAVAMHSGVDDPDRTATFAALRRWKDGFRA